MPADADGVFSGGEGGVEGGINGGVGITGCDDTAGGVDDFGEDVEVGAAGGGVDGEVDVASGGGEAEGVLIGFGLDDATVEDGVVGGDF